MILPPYWGHGPHHMGPLHTDTFVYFWVFWGVLVILFVVLHIIRMISECLERLEPLPEPAESVFKAEHCADDEFRTCSICLEDFVDDDKLHWLPCSHVVCA